MDFKMSYCWYVEKDGYKHERRERWVRIRFWDECWPISRVPCLKVCFSFLFFVYGSHEAIRFLFLILACPTLSTDPMGKRDRDRETQWDRAGLSVADQGLDNPTSHNECEHSGFDRIKLWVCLCSCYCDTNTSFNSATQTAHPFMPVT